MARLRTIRDSFESHGPQLYRRYLLRGAAARGGITRSGIFLTELVDAAGRIDNLLLAGIERVAVRAHFDLQIVSEGRAGLERIAARAIDRDLFVFGMD